MLILVKAASVRTLLPVVFSPTVCTPDDILELLCRMWSLVDDEKLHYKHLDAFDAAMHKLEESHPWLISHVSVTTRPPVLQLHKYLHVSLILAQS